MKTLPIKNPVSGVDLVTAAVGCFNRLVDAYETSKRIELEREQLECQHDLDKRKLAIMERDLERRYKMATRALDMRDKELTAKLALIERHFHVYEGKMQHLHEQSKMAMERVCNGDAKDREFFMQLWLKINEVGSRTMAVMCEDIGKGMLEYNRQVACLLGDLTGRGAGRQLQLAQEDA